MEPGMPGTGGLNQNKPQTGITEVTSSGKSFITTFMQNDISKGLPDRQIVVTAASGPAKVSVSLNNFNFKKVVTVRKGQTVVIPIDIKTELRGTKNCTQSVIVEADADVSVMSRNYKGNSGDMALIYPAGQLGLEYYIITPPKGPENQFKEFFVLAYKTVTNVDVFLKGSVTVNGKNYAKGDKLTLNLRPYEAFQIQSKEDLSGTKVVGDNPIAVMAGHTCAENNNGCSHVYEQLKPVGSWGASFLVPGLSFQSKYDLVLIMASQSTVITYQSGTVNQTKNVAAGDLIQVNLTVSSPLSIQCIQGIQVLLLGLGGTYKGKPFGSFLSRIRDTDSFGLGYSLIGEKDFDTNLGIIIAKTSNSLEIQFDGKSSNNFVWNKFPGTEYSWVEYSYGSGFSTHTVQHPTIPFGLLSIGYTVKKAYGSLAPCFTGRKTQWITGSWQFPKNTRPTESKWSGILNGVGETTGGWGGGTMSGTGKRPGILSEIFNVGGNLLGNAGEVLKDVGETTGKVVGGTVSGTGKRPGILSEIFNVGGNLLGNAGGVLKNVGETTGRVVGGTSSSMGPIQGLVSGVLNTGGNLLSDTGDLLSGVGGTAGGTSIGLGGTSSSTGPVQGLVSGVLNAGGNILSGAGGILSGIGGTAGGKTSGLSGGGGISLTGTGGSTSATGPVQGLVSGVLNAGGKLLSDTGGILSGIGGTTGGKTSGLSGGGGVSVTGTGGTLSSTGPVQGLLSGVLNAGGKLLSDTGGILSGVGGTTGGKTGGLSGGGGVSVKEKRKNLLMIFFSRNRWHVIIYGASTRISVGVLNAGGKLLSDTGGILSGIGGTAGGKTGGLSGGGGVSVKGGTSSSTGPVQGLVSGVLNAGGNLLSNAGGVLKDVGGATGGHAGGVLKVAGATSSEKMAGGRTHKRPGLLSGLLKVEPHIHYCNERYHVTAHYRNKVPLPETWDMRGPRQERREQVSGIVKDVGDTAEGLVGGILNGGRKTSGGSAAHDVPAMRCFQALSSPWHRSRKLRGSAMCRYRYTKRFTNDHDQRYDLAVIVGSVPLSTTPIHQITGILDINVDTERILSPEMNSVNSAVSQIFTY
ncbi:unnamed protein product [Ranitomeya imitator]|uniref:IgGFc-binding protein N-terminal domain-containing protein n=1 Tax=Ranitomeya imitator TaxID=111125 RepID=A0ABN9LE57_9NEOB|nr:unnamed protein product [Ranitomeya imitator]